MSTVPAGWDTGKDAKGRTYYVNQQTKATQWELPTAPALPSTPPPAYSSGPPAPAVVHATPVQAAPTPAPQQTVHQPPPQQVIYQPAVTHQPVQVIERSAPANNAGPPGAPAGGHWMPDKYVGPITIILGFVLFFPTCFFPCDSRMVYVVNGIKYDQAGAMVTGMC